MIIRRLARPMLSTIFVFGGINAVRDVEGHAQAAKPWLDKTIGQSSGSLPDGIPTEPATLVKVDAGVKLGAGAMLALGKCPRLASLALLGSLVPTTLANHAYWEFQDPGQRQGQQVQFMKNISLAGALLLSASESSDKSASAPGSKKKAAKSGKAAPAVESAEHTGKGKAGKAAKADKAGKAGKAGKASKKAAENRGKRSQPGKRGAKAAKKAARS